MNLEGYDAGAKEGCDFQMFGGSWGIGLMGSGRGHSEHIDVNLLWCYEIIRVDRKILND